MGEIISIEPANAVMCIGCSDTVAIILKIKSKKVWKGTVDSTQNASIVLGEEWSGFTGNYIQKSKYIFFSNKSFTTAFAPKKDLNFPPSTRVLRIKDADDSIVNVNGSVINVLDSLK